MLFIYVMGHYVPFGEKSLASMDATIQYLDFFSYFRDVLLGKNSLAYTFSKTLGGNAIAVYSYYLASPLNFLVLFFEKSQLQAFFNLLVLLKLALAGATSAYFLNVRFERELREKPYADIYVVLLSLSYALSQYSLAQSSNIMWLDGVYMLPLILLGVYSVVQGEEIWKLSIPVVFSILFNWYTGGINCLFSGFWFLLEYALKEIEKEPAKWRVKPFVAAAAKYVAAMLLGVLCSCVLFLPTIGAMRTSSKGVLNLGMLKDLSFVGDIPSLIQSYTYGAKSAYGKAALYCGALPLIGALGFFISKAVSKKKKWLLGIASGVAVLMLYWKPFCVFFSLLKRADSYWYRYSYGVIFFLVFLAGYFYLAVEEMSKEQLSKATGIYAGLLLLIYYLQPQESRNRVYLTAVVLVLAATLMEQYRMAVKGGDGKKRRKIALVLAVVVLADLTFSSKVMMWNYHVEDTKTYQTYVEQEEQQIETLKEYDSSDYRISQTSTRNMSADRNTANFNEALAYNYYSITGYTSAPDDVQLDFLERIGYRAEGATMSIVTTSVIGADSLMGVKYVLSSYPLNGLQELPELGEYNGKKTYLNPYALPMAFTYCKSDAYETEYTNPFEYQNRLYSELLGETVELYKPVEYETIQQGDTDSQTEQIYQLALPQGNVAIYANIPWISTMNAHVSVNGESTIYGSLSNVGAIIK
jgi:uncharacterized membrane protein YfhO